MTRTAQTLRETRRDLANAADAQLLAATRMVDQMAERGEADRLLQPVRDRLGLLRPERPLRFRRLMFTPLDWLIIDAPRWRLETPFLPRTALAPLETLLRRQDPVQCNRIDAMLAEINLARAQGEPAAELASMQLLATGKLWPLAGAGLRQCVLAAEQTPSEWRAAGLPASCFAPLASGVAFLLGSIAGLTQAGSEAAERRDTLLFTVLRGAEAVGVQCWSMALCLIMLRFPDSPIAYQAAVRIQPAWRGAGNAAMDAALASIGESARMGGVTPSDAAVVHQHIAALASLAQAAASQPARVRDIKTQQADVLEQYLARFTTALRTGLLLNLAPFATKPGPPPSPARDGMVQALEETARHLRGFEGAVRGLGSGKDMEQALIQAGCQVAKAVGLAPIERARLVDLLAGPQQALRVLRTAIG